MLRVVLFGLLLPFAAFAQGLPAPLGDTVSDYADVLAPGAEAEVSDLIRRIRDETGVHIAVATMDRIADHGGAEQTITGYGKALFNAWGVGHGEDGGADRDDGILILIAADDREVRIALGSGYDAVYDGRAQRVIDTAMLPEFKEGRFAAGILRGVQSARDRLVTPFLAGLPVTVDEGFPARDRSALWWLGGIAVAGVGLIGYRAVRNARRRCPKCRELTLTRQRDVVLPATVHAAGSGVDHLTCVSCGFIERRPFQLAPGQESNRFGGTGRGGDGDGDNEGGGSGFGGGRSSGGGATGRW